MILSINTINRDKIYLGFFDGKIKKCFDFVTENQSEDLLIDIQKVLKKANISLSDLKSIIVNLGPGSFTGVRVGVTVANTLAWTLDIPIYGYKEDEQDKILAKIIRKSQNKFLKSVIPYYEIS